MINVATIHDNPMFKAISGNLSGKGNGTAVVGGGQLVLGGEDRKRRRVELSSPKDVMVVDKPNARELAGGQY